MRTEAQAKRLFFRRIPLDCFGQFMGPDLLAAVRRYDDPRRRCRQMGLQGFLWLGLLVAAYTALPSLEAIFWRVGPMLASGAVLGCRLVSVSAFTQFRGRFPLRVLMRVWHLLADQARRSLDESRATWRGLRLWAGDGTGLCLPEELWVAFGAHKGCRGDGPAQGHLVVLYDLAARVPVRLRLAPYQTKERALAVRLLNHLGAGDLVMLDGGFYSIGLFAQLQRQGAHWLVPMRANGTPRRLRYLGPGDGLYEIRASQSYWKDVPEVPKTMVVRIITVHRRGFRPRRLVTDLVDAKAFPANELAEVYHQRWHIETFYRELKHTLKVQHWHARTLRGVYAELFFTMILACLTRLAMIEAAAKDGSVGPLSFGRCLQWVNIALAATATTAADQWALLYEDLLTRIRRCRIDVRPERNFERDRQKRRKTSRAKRLAASQEGQP